jgi:hypothetical protein
MIMKLQAAKSRHQTFLVFHDFAAFFTATVLSRQMSGKLEMFIATCLLRNIIAANMRQICGKHTANTRQ